MNHYIKKDFLVFDLKPLPWHCKRSLRGIMCVMRVPNSLELKQSKEQCLSHCELKTSHLITLGHRENTSAASVDQVSTWDMKMPRYFKCSLIFVKSVFPY